MRAYIYIYQSLSTCSNHTLKTPAGMPISLSLVVCFQTFYQMCRQQIRRVLKHVDTPFPRPHLCGTNWIFFPNKKEIFGIHTSKENECRPALYVQIYVLIYTVYLHLYIHVHIHIYVYTYTYMFMHVFMRACICRSICICILNAYLHVNVNVHVNVYVYNCMYLYLQIGGGCYPSRKGGGILCIRGGWGGYLKWQAVNRAQL